ncbi:hypothetical protein GCM10010399_30920 [Dactylosporangium fulvum]
MIFQIAGAIQLAGFRHVISTLRTVEDRAAAELAQAVYGRMTGPDKNLEPARAPEALHHAVRGGSLGETLPVLPVVMRVRIRVPDCPGRLDGAVRRHPAG